MFLQKIQKNQFSKYKGKSEDLQKEFVQNGNYLVSSNITNEMKKIFPCTPTIDSGGCFKWIIPAESWVLREITDEKIQYLLDTPFNFDNYNEKFYKVEKTLLRWQKEFLNMASNDLKEGKAFRKGLIAGVGAGKTLVYLMLSLLGDTLYIAPRHLHSTIELECEKWEIPLPVITTPESVEKIIEKNFYKEFRIAIIDESLSCKNPEAQRTKKVIKNVESFDIIVSATATPLSVNPLDIRWINTVGSVLPSTKKNFIYNFGINPHFMDLSKLGVEHTFIDHEGNTKTKNPLSCDSYDLEKLSIFLKDSLVTVDIADILEQLPGVQHRRIKLSTPRFFNVIKRGFVTDKSSMKAIKQAMTCTSGFYYEDNQKIKRINPNHKLEWLKAAIIDNPGEKMVVFSNWTAEQEILKEELEKLENVPLAFNTSSINSVEKFCRGEANILISSASLSEGMNLQMARIGVFMSYPLSPAKLKQAYGRLHRQGQKKGVIFYHLVCKDTFDESLLDLLEKHINESDEFIEKSLKQELIKKWGKNQSELFD
jgi:hypothetical protein